MKRRIKEFNASLGQARQPTEAIGAFVWAHLGFVRIHPFFDSSGRMAQQHHRPPCYQPSTCLALSPALWYIPLTMKSLRQCYECYMMEQNREGSNKASSYVRALELLGPILGARVKAFAHCSDLFVVDSPRLIGDLYDYVLEQQNRGESGIFDPRYKPSYWRNGFYSAALKSYKEFLVLQRHETELWEIYNAPNTDPKELGKRLLRKPLDTKALIDDGQVDFTTREGKETLRQVKTRVNQCFFRAMILRDYGTRCCITGLTVPEVLRASHIVGWADDKENRMNPSNGLCLSATYDAAFDRHLITFDEDFRLVLRPSIKEFYTNEAFKRFFLAFEGCHIQQPTKFRPDQALLEQHRSGVH